MIGTPLDLPSKALLLVINATYNGQLTVELPRTIIDSKNQGIDQPYFVAVGGLAKGLSKVDAIETSDNYTRTLKINFTKNTSEVEIVGTYFVEKYQSMTPIPSRLLSPLKQFKSGIAANDVKCGIDLSLVIKAEDGSPACVKPDTAKKLVARGWGWAMQAIGSLKPLLPNRIVGLENDTGVVTFGNQTYYFETPNYTNTAYSNPVQIPFHDVVFTLFPPGFHGGLPTNVGCGNVTVGELIVGGGSYFWTDAKYSDGIHELLHIYADSKPCPLHPIPTHFSNHTNPQAGLTFYNGKMKLLVSTDNQSSSALRLYLSTNSTSIQPGQPIGITISVNNTLSTLLNISSQNNWLDENVSTGPCSRIGYGISILEGFFTVENLTKGKNLFLYSFDTNCPFITETASVYEFQPESDRVTEIQCKQIQGISCYPGQYEMGGNFGFNGYWEGGNYFKPFKPGIYTIVGEDEWGHLAIQHFTVENSTDLSMEHQAPQNTTLPTSFIPCDSPYEEKSTTTSPVYPNGTVMTTGYIPVLYMPLNSTGTLCVKYTDSSQTIPAGIRIFEADNLSRQANIAYYASPDTIAKGNSTVRYTITTGNQGGFYGISFSCGGIPFAVGYDNQSRIITDDFPWLNQVFHCGIITYNYKISGLHGIGIYYIKAVSHEQLSYDIQNTTVTSYSMGTNGHNATFSLHIRTFDKPARFWFDYKDSTATKFMTNPGFKQGFDACNWDVIDNNPMQNTQWLRIDGIHVRENPVTIPANSDGFYTFSILAENLSDGYYALNPVVYGATTDVSPDEAGSNSIAYNFPIIAGIGNTKILDFSGTCLR